MLVPVFGGCGVVCFAVCGLFGPVAAAAVCLAGLGAVCGGVGALFGGFGCGVVGLGVAGLAGAAVACGVLAGWGASAPFL